MSFPSHRTNASGNISKGLSRWRQKGGPARIRRCGVIRRIRRFLLKWHSRETIKGDIPRRQESAELLSGRKPASRAWRFGEEISGSLPMWLALSSASRRRRAEGIAWIRVSAVLIMHKAPFITRIIPRKDLSIYARVSVTRTIQAALLCLYICSRI